MKNKGCNSMTATACSILEGREYVRDIKSIIKDVQNDCDEKDITKLYYEIGDALHDMIDTDVSGTCYSALASRLLDDAVSDIQWEYVARHLVMKIFPKKTKRHVMNVR